MARVVPRAAFALLLALSLYLFLTPVPEVGPRGSDKVGHVAIFAVLALSGRWAGVRWLPLGAALAAYAALTEVLQATLPLGRRGDPADLLADLVGTVVGLLVAAALTRARRGAPSPSRRPG